MTARLDVRTATLLTLPPLLWAGNAVVGRLVVGAIPPLMLNALRWWLALALLLPLGWRVLRQPARIRRRSGYFCALGLLGFGSYNALQYTALETSSPINVTLIGASVPLWTLLLGALFFRVRPGLRQCLGALLSLAGVVLVLTHGDPAALAGIRLVRGDLLMLLATAVWALYSWLLARPPPGLREEQPLWGWSEILTLQVLFGVFWASVLAGAGQAIHPAPIEWTMWTVAALVFVAVGPSLIGYRAWGAGVARAGPATATLFQNMTPAFAALMSAALLGEPPRAYHALAFVLIVGGIMLPLRRR